MLTAAETDEAWAVGWATVNDPDTLPMGRTAHAAQQAAAEVATDLWWVAETAEQTARRLALHRARLRLYHQHATAIVAATAGLADRIDIHHLVTSMLMAGTDRHARRDQAHTALVNAATGTIRVRMDAANTVAWTAATARGAAEAAASTHGPADPATVTAGMAAALAAVGLSAARVGGMAMTERELSRLAWELSTSAHLDDEPFTAATISQAEPVHNAAQDLMHAALATAFVGYITAQGNNGLLWWQTEEDERVCPQCDGYEADGPYQPGDIPDCPAHPDCRCSIETY